MAHIPRNYIAEIGQLGVFPFRDIAKELKVSTQRLHSWRTGRSIPPKSLYEPIRNIARRATYTRLRQAGFPSYRASEFRRAAHPEAVMQIRWLDKIIDTLYNDWNFRYRAYMANPEGWIKAHPNKKIPRETSRAEVKRRIELGIKRGKSKEQIENY